MAHLENAKHAGGSADVAGDLRSRKVDVRLAAVRAIAEDPSPDADLLLLKAVGDRSGVVAARAIRALGERAARSGDRHAEDVREKAANVMIERYWSVKPDGKKLDPGCLVRIEIVRVLGEWRVHQAADLFFDAVETVQVERSGNGLEDVAIPLRAQAAAAIASVRPPGALLALSVLLFDDDPRMEALPQDRPFRTVTVRKAAARSLAILGDPGGVAVLGVRLSRWADELPEVLVECMDALKALDEEAALKVIAPFLHGADAYLAASAAVTLASLSQPHHNAVLERLSQALIDRIDDAKSAIALAIASMRCDEAVDTLTELARYDDPPVALEAIRALAERGDAPSHAALEAIVSECEDPLVRMKAKEALSKF